jgi:hexosaminidase
MRVLSGVNVLFFFLTIGSAMAQVATSNPAVRLTLMPVPASVRLESGRLPVSASFTAGTTKFADLRLQRAIDRMCRRLEAHTGIQMARGLARDPGAATLIVEVERAGDPVQSVDEVESYALDVTPKQAVLRAETVVGAIHGLETFLQLVDADSSGYYIPAVSIQDNPRFRWRGLMIDVSRHWEPVEVIKRNLDGMAAVKLNVFHWHLTDDQGFRIESKKYPKLQEMGSDGLYYTQDQVRDVIAYARDRGIRVIPEFDLPAHSTSWLVGYPELASAPGPYQIERNYGIFDPTMDPTQEKTYKFLDGFIGEMAALFPDAYMHIGGDENSGVQWKNNPKIQAFMKSKNIKDAAALQVYFSQRLQKILQKHGKKTVGWDEILQPDLPKDVVVQSWRGVASLAAGAKQGYPGILSAPYYLDQIYPASQHYEADPLPSDSGLTPDQAALILGGEACQWAELINSDSIDSRIWPRMAAVAERFWSPREVRDVSDMYRRLDVMSVRLEELGLTHVSHTDMLLRRQAGSADISPFRALMQTVQPGTFDQRSDTQNTSQLTPMTHLVDAANPDPSYGREFAGQVNAFLADSPQHLIYADELAETFRRWRDLRLSAEPLMQRSPVLREAEPRFADLSQLGEAGLEAIMYLQSGMQPPSGWKEAKLAVVDEAAKPKAVLRFVVLDPVRQLIVAASQAGGTATPGQAPVQ